MKKHYFTFILFCFMLPTQAQKLLPSLQTYCQGLEKEFSKIGTERKENLQKIADFVKKKQKAGEKINLTFICTHNSRRSQFGQVWAKIAAVFYGFEADRVHTFSGGTEATACNPRTVEALKRAGVKIEPMSEISAPVTVAKNPRYAMFFAEKTPPEFLFSKKYNDEQNPQKNYCAVLVCSSADEACPVVFGAETRIYHGYEDPKRSDDTPEESKIYDETCRLIAREIFYLFSQAKK